jgi:hypothetical protein
MANMAHYTDPKFGISETAVIKIVPNWTNKLGKIA